MPAHSHRNAGLALAGAVLLSVALAGCSGNQSGNAATPAYTGPAPTVAQSGQVFTSPQLDNTLTPVSGAAGLTVPDSNGGLTITVSKTGQPQLVTQNGNNYVPGDGLGFVAVEVTAAQLATPYPTWSQGNTQPADTTAQFLVDNAPVDQPVNLPYAGATASWTITAPTASQVVLQITSGVVVQTLDARTGQPSQAKTGAAATGITFAGEDTPTQNFSATPPKGSINDPFGGSVSASFPAGSAYLAGYVDKTGWAPDGQRWLVIAFKTGLVVNAQCNPDTWLGPCNQLGTASVKAATFTLTGTNGSAVDPYGTSTSYGVPTGFIYQVPVAATSFTLAVAFSLNYKGASLYLDQYTFAPSPIPFTHTYTLTFQ